MNRPKTNFGQTQETDQKKQMIERGIILINQNFTDDLLDYAYFAIHQIMENRYLDSIKVYINSNGGQVSTLFPLYDLLISAGKQKPVETYITGKAYSAGAILALAGGKRFAHKHSMILLHEVSDNFGYQKNTQIQHEAEWINQINESLKQIIKDRTKMTTAQIEQYMGSNTDIFITAQQAKKYGIITQII